MKGILKANSYVTKPKFEEEEDSEKKKGCCDEQSGVHSGTVLVKPWVNGDCTDCEEYLKLDNFLSEYVSLGDKARVRKNLGIPDNMSLIWGNITGNLDKQEDLVARFESLDRKKIDSSRYDEMVNPMNHLYASDDLGEGVSNVKEALDALAYKDLVIDSIYCKPNLLESGEIASNVTVYWSYNKRNIVTQSINKINVANSKRSYTTPNSVKTDTTFKLTATDKKMTKEASTSIRFVPGRYYGVSSNSNITNSEYIVSNFARSLTLSYGNSFTVTAGPGEYIYLLVPKSMQNVTFWVGGFEGGFSLLNDSFKFSKYPNKVEICCLFRSEKTNLGKTTVTIK